MAACDIKGRANIVTGAGSGIGLALADMLLQAGSDVVFADLNLRLEAKWTVQTHSLSTEASAPVVEVSEITVRDVQAEALYPSLDSRWAPVDATMSYW
ncbi:unnamed protein product [Penicillium glandicola]